MLLTVLRLVQGFALGGEWGGAVLLVSEHGDARRRGFWASWPQTGAPAGQLLATGVLALLTALLSDAAFTSWGWRMPFLLSGVLVIVGCGSGCLSMNRPSSRRPWRRPRRARRAR